MAAQPHEEALTDNSFIQAVLGRLQATASKNFLSAKAELQSFVEQTAATFSEEPEKIEMPLLDENPWSLLVKNVPEAIASADPLGFGRFDEVTPDDLRPILNNI
jgi:hypothetical protein